MGFSFLPGKKCEFGWSNTFSVVHSNDMCYHQLLLQHVVQLRTTVKIFAKQVCRYAFTKPNKNRVSLLAQ